MKKQDTTAGHVTTKAKAQETARQWHNPSLGYHAEAVKKGSGYICRLVIND